MIRACEDVKTMDDLCEFGGIYRGTCDMGLEETAKMICWNVWFFMNPTLYTALKNDQLLRRGENK